MRADAPPGPRPVAALSDTELLGRFEGLGSGCEFGFVQRFAGVEAAGLLRFASAPLDGLLRGLATRFDGIDDPDGIEIVRDADTDEWLGRVSAYGFLYHTGLWVAETDLRVAHARQGRRLGLMKRMLLDQLERGAKILVRFGEGEEEVAVRAIAAAVAGFGPGTVLWVTLAGEGRPEGTVERLGPNLLRGRVGRWWRADLRQRRFDVAMPDWLSICRNALRMVAEDRGAERLAPAASPERPDLLVGLVRADEPIARNVALPGAGETAHVLLMAAAFPHAVVQAVLVAGRLRADTVHAVAMEVWLPPDFAGTLVTATFEGLAALQHVSADCGRREVWQTIWATATAPPGAVVRVCLMVQGGVGETVISRNWRLSEGSCLTTPGDGAGRVALPPI